MFPVILLQRMIFSKFFTVTEVLTLSQSHCHHDVTIVCSSGTIQSNSFVLAAVFPLLRGSLETPLLYPDPAVILIPDLNKTHLETFLNDHLHHQSIVTISRDLKDLMQFELEVFNVEDVTDILINSDRDTSFKRKIFTHYGKLRS